MDEYLVFAKELAAQAGNIMKEHFHDEVDTEHKEDDTPVTVADKAINRLVVDAVLETYPEHRILGEEESAGPDGAKYVWVCDPIDGTIPYTFQVPVSTFLLALVKDGKPIVAVMYEPHSERLFEATENTETLLNGKPVQLTERSTLQGGYISSAAMKHGILDNISFIRDFSIDNATRTFSLFCIGAETDLLLRGKIVGCIYPGTTAWDIAALKLLVEQAGGRVTNLRGEEQRYDQELLGAVISNGYVHDDLVELTSKHILKD